MPAVGPWRCDRRIITTQLASCTGKFQPYLAENSVIFWFIGQKVVFFTTAGHEMVIAIGWKQPCFTIKNIRLISATYIYCTKTGEAVHPRGRDRDLIPLPTPDSDGLDGSTFSSVRFP